MDDSEIQLERIRVDAELKREELRQGVRKVIYGTMIVGVAAALFPFAQGIAESIFAERIAKIKRESDIEILQEKNRLEESKSNLNYTLSAQKSDRDFLQSLAQEGRSAEIGKRI